ncbi:leucine zipper domain-containing protein [Micromonospora sp. R77]|uniref:leucine zipper domain-containing protein n=1 Tax=Micromonospora sp. R77 TaxID=2925836 RepID=UPI0035AE2232
MPGQSTTVKRWDDRHREEGLAGMIDRSRGPHWSPRRTPAPSERKVLHLRVRRRKDPPCTAGRLGVATSTVTRDYAGQGGRAGTPMSPFHLA